MYVHLGTYDGGIISFEGLPESLRPTNNFQASENSIRALHRTGKYLIAGGFDETLHIYDVLRNREEGQVDPEQGPITQLVSDGKILISAGGQGTIKMWRVGSFEFLHQLKEHKGQIEHLTVDSSGRIMFSVGKDRKLIMWNLLKAVRIFDRKLQFDVAKVLLTEDRQRLVLLGEREIRVVETESNTEVSRFQSKQKLQDCVIYLDKYLIVGGETGSVNIWPIDKFQNCLKFQACDSRVKCLAVVKLEEQDILFTASSNGQLCMWDVLTLLKEIDSITQDYSLESLKPIGKFEVGQRIICMIAGALPSKEPQQKKIEPIANTEVADEPVKKTKKNKNVGTKPQLTEVHRKKKIHKLKEGTHQVPSKHPHKVKPKKNKPAQPDN